MQVLDEIRFNDNRILLKDNLVKSPILPKISRDLERDVVVQGDCEVQGAVFARNLEVQQGPLRVKGCASALRKSDPLVLARSAPGQEQHS